MAEREQLPPGMFVDDVYTITPQIKIPATLPQHDPWLTAEPEGQLSVDVFEVENAVVIATPIAGVKPEDLEVYVSQDLITIRGKREDCSTHAERAYLYQECHWGRFSRTIILPVQVSNTDAQAVLKNGVLTITLPKQHSLYVPISEIE